MVNALRLLKMPLIYRVFKNVKTLTALKKY